MDSAPHPAFDGPPDRDPALPVQHCYPYDALMTHVVDGTDCHHHAGLCGTVALPSNDDLDTRPYCAVCWQQRYALEKAARENTPVGHVRPRATVTVWA